MATIQTWYNFVLQQMAAESYLDGINLGTTPDVIRRLRLGNNQEGFPETSLTRLTDPQAQYFVDNFRIVDHHANDRSGFSATLIRKLDSNGNPTNEYTLSFRSTEYRDQADGGDWERDGINGADGSIVNTGFAFAQLAAMEDYYTYLKTTPGLLPAGAVLNVTGYSLGAHMATVFTELHGNEVNHTHTPSTPPDAAPSTPASAASPTWSPTFVRCWPTPTPLPAKCHVLPSTGIGMNTRLRWRRRTRRGQPTFTTYRTSLLANPIPAITGLFSPRKRISKPAARH